MDFHPDEEEFSQSVVENGVDRPEVTRSGWWAVIIQELINSSAASLFQVIFDSARATPEFSFEP